MSARGPLRPPTGELQVVTDVPSAFADLVARVVGSAPGDGRARLALSGGETARACYERLARKDGLDWSRVECFVGDERCVPPADPDANQRLIRESLVERVPVAAFHPMDCERAGDYEALLGAAPPLDLVHLGLGPDGHTASLVPGDTVLEVDDRRVAMTGEAYQDHLRMTLTYPALNDARQIIWLVTGPDKREPLQKLLAGDTSIPAGRVKNENMFVVADEAAAG